MNTHPSRVQFCAYRPAIKFTSGSKEAKRQAKRAVSAALLRHLVEELGQYSGCGRWPWQGTAWDPNGWCCMPVSEW